ncbi:MAG: NAD(+) diphosphatase [Lachnospiraceae bacterium]|nr:NAD(+) diphosphatase [Lachnospiraceae bacterium]
MIQDIFPSKLNNSYANHTPSDDDCVFAFDDEGRLLAKIREGHTEFPSYKMLRFAACIYLFSIDDDRYYLTLEDRRADLEEYEALSIRKVRDKARDKKLLFAAFTAYHLWKWYTDNRFCGKCAMPLVHDDRERALRCPRCGNIIYPRINPAVIVGVINGDRLLITRYNRGYAHNALVAGFAEIGETLEETVSREVMEEAGIKVGNIKYYKSQPWGMAQDLLTGFFCEVEGDDTIHMDEGELKYAAWVSRDEIELQPNDLSLTNEMMRMFKENRL